MNYEWNEWALRRRALQLTNVRKCVTESQQTDLSHFRRDNDSQVWLPKLKVTQTRTEGGNHAPQVTRFVAGLRGEADPKRQPSRFALQKTGAPGVLHMVLEPGAAEGHAVFGTGTGGKGRAF